MDQKVPRQRLVFHPFVFVIRRRFWPLRTRITMASEATICLVYSSLLSRPVRRTSYATQAARHSRTQVLLCCVASYEDDGDAVV